MPAPPAPTCPLSSHPPSCDVSVADGVLGEDDAGEDEWDEEGNHCYGVECESVVVVAGDGE